LASSYPPQFFTILGISLDSVSGSIARGMPYLQLLLLRKVQEKFSFMMVEEITSQGCHKLVICPKKNKKNKTQCVQSAIKQDMPVLFQYPERWQMFNIYLIKKTNS